MILGFKNTLPDGTPSYFIDKIVAGRKQHTIRKDNNKRWEVGNLIHFVVNHRQPTQRQFAWGTCVDIQEIKIIPQSEIIQVQRGTMKGGWYQLTDGGKNAIAKNDGFASVDDLFKWFDKPFAGRIVFWGDIIPYSMDTHGADLARVNDAKLGQFLEYNNKNRY